MKKIKLNVLNIHPAL